MMLHGDVLSKFPHSIILKHDSPHIIMSMMDLITTINRHVYNCMTQLILAIH